MRHVDVVRPDFRARQLRLRADRADRRPRQRRAGRHGVCRAGETLPSRRRRRRRRQRRRLRRADPSSGGVVARAGGRRAGIVPANASPPGWYSSTRPTARWRRSSSNGIWPGLVWPSPAGATCRSTPGPAARWPVPTCRACARCSSTPPPAWTTPRSSARCSSRAGAPRTALRDDPQFYVVTLSAHASATRRWCAGPAARRVPGPARSPTLASDAVVFHQRFSTNTAAALAAGAAVPPARAQRRDQHDRRQPPLDAGARARRWRSPRVDLADIRPARVAMHGSDSQSLDNMLELLLAGGIDLLQAMRILVPPAYAVAASTSTRTSPRSTSTTRLHSEPWDGPAGLVMCDGRYAACTLDRNGLRPARWAAVRRQPPDRRFRGRRVGRAGRAHRRQGQARPGRDARGRSRRQAPAARRRHRRDQPRRAPFKRLAARRASPISNRT